MAERMKMNIGRYCTCIGDMAVCILVVRMHSESERINDVA